MAEAILGPLADIEQTADGSAGMRMRFGQLTFIGSDVPGFIQTTSGDFVVSVPAGTTLAGLSVIISAQVQALALGLGLTVLVGNTWVPSYQKI